MNLSLIDIVDRFTMVIWPMLRISAFLAFTSMFSIRAVNLRIRISLSFALALFVTLQTPFRASTLSRGMACRKSRAKS